MHTKQASKHDSDFYGWTQEQAGILRETPAEDTRLDIANLAEEIEDMGRAEILAISSLLRRTVIHLLKLAIEPDSPSVDHWFDEIVTFQGDAVLARQGSSSDLISKKFGASHAMEPPALLEDTVLSFRNCRRPVRFRWTTFSIPNSILKRPRKPCPRPFKQ